MLEIKGVSKWFGKFQALNNISFNVNNGELVGYVGLNGAGKTTTIRIIVGVLPPDKGDVLIDGYSITYNKRQASKLIGWVPELPIFEPDVKALDYFVYLAGYYGLSSREAYSLGKKLFEEVGLSGAEYKKLQEYSQGMKKRFALAVSMINDPPNFVFDEVLNGLDPEGIKFFRELAKKFKKEGKSVLFSSHILSEVEAIADRVVFIHKGRIINSLSMQEIKRMASKKLVLSLGQTPSHNIVDKLREYGRVSIEGNIITIEDFNGEQSSIIELLVNNGYKVNEIKLVEKSLEDVFFKLIGEQK
ncbi:ABC transporter related [Staphylothermus marinus F1]|uniref:ABC transporter related n=1 Tax=Staphylothermus marinus (strain ATCC 43588 / DSM 3639 / JCM 9404 / F1) TaxID=399550 RepID=A3DKR7_STAMF|nr:ABC transporter ATP-binding protein [Staphylothermus marinus]ABN69227.1 ABC transporter related [Staphylothermus marinus F1]